MSDRALVLVVDDEPENEAVRRIGRWRQAMPLAAREAR